MKKILSVFLLCLLSFAAHAQTAAAVKDTVDHYFQADKKYPFPTVKDRAYALRYVVDWVAANFGAGGGSWGSITGTLSNQTDLNTALSDKASLSASYANPSWITSLPFTKITGTATVSQIGTGTPGAGKYVDGGTGAWTDLPAGGGGASTSSANTWTAVQTFSDTIRTNFVKSRTGDISFRNSIGTEVGRAYSTGRWYMGASPTDDGVATLNVNGIIKTSQIRTSNFNSPGTTITVQDQYTQTIGVLEYGRVRFGLNASTAIPSASLAINSTTSGFLPPRMTATQASAISSPAEGLMLYVTDTNGTFTAKGWWGYDGAAWQKLNN